MIEYQELKHVDLGEFVDWVWALKSELDQLKAEVEALRKDAERYRWLRKTESWEDAMMGIRDLWIVSSREEVANTDGDFLDAAIDAAMSKEADQ